MTRKSSDLSILFFILYGFALINFTKKGLKLIFDHSPNYKILARAFNPGYPEISFRS